jgi:uncharacterized protein (DUF1800 family)
MSLEATIATNRFGLGATPGQIAKVAQNPKAWLLSQVRNPAAALISGAGLPSSQQAYAAFLDYVQDRRAAREKNADPLMAEVPAPATVQRIVNLAAQSLSAETQARMTHAITTPAPFLERWVMFWSNRLTMAAKNPQTNFFVGPYEREAIRPHVLGSFSDLLTSANLHPGMLIYLDQVRSVGPSAPGTAMARNRRRPTGLNENLAREILELHTLGANGGYSQADVTEFARALTGWTIQLPRNNRGNQREADFGRTIFIDALHEPGPRTMMGTVFAQSGRDQAPAILDWLARRPQTARTIARAVAIHFVSDNPPTSLIGRLEQNFLVTNGNLAALAETLINSPEAWTPQQGKFKSPSDFLISTLRAGGTTSVTMAGLRSTFTQLGQTPWRAPSPKGWPDTASDWAAPDAILKRVDWSNLAADVIGQTMTPMAFASSALGATLSPQTSTAISRAGDARQGIVLALMSPEFQRR